MTGARAGSGVHYDTNPQVFELMLDRNMNYSSGYYLTGEEDLDQAQVHKMDKIAAMCGMKPGDRVLDVGCGWTGPARYFAREHGCAVTGLTLSEVQRDYGLEQARAAGVADRIEIVVRDVMNAELPPESFDHVLFLESIIHMPQKAEIFGFCERVLRPGGMTFVQESCYDRNSLTESYRADRGFQAVDEAFGQTGDMVSAGEMLRLMEEAGLVPVMAENISQHYVKTLAQWGERIDQHGEEMRAACGDFFPMLRRYIMLALTTYRVGQTVCFMLAAQKPANTWSRSVIA